MKIDAAPAGLMSCLTFPETCHAGLLLELRRKFANGQPCWFHFEIRQKDQPSQVLFVGGCRGGKAPVNHLPHM